jgi:prephenate dehydrogenase
MRYVYENAAYGPDPVRDLYWSTTVPHVSLPKLKGSLETDVAIIGAGFTGLSAAYHLGQAGVDISVLDAQHPMFGATGRNGGFCCLGGGKISNARWIIFMDLTNDNFTAKLKRLLSIWLISLLQTMT